MATSSITKEFTVKDKKAYSKMLKEIDDRSARPHKVAKSSHLERGAKLLKQFSFH